MFSLEEVEKALPSHLKGSITPDIVDHLNKVVTDPNFAVAIRDNLIGFTKVLSDGKFKTADYFTAVTYVSFKLMGYSDRECYQRTFPDRYQALVARNASSKDIAAYVSAYNKNKLVNLIYEQSLTPSWVLNQDMFQKALNVQFELMQNANSEKVRTDAANSILTHLKPPETKKVQLDIGAVRGDDMDVMMEQMRQLAGNQKKLIEMGIPTRQIAHEKMIYEAEVIENGTD